MNECLNAFEKKDDRKLKELSPYFFKLSQLFKEFAGVEGNEVKNDDDDQYSVDNLMKSLIESLNEIMLKCENEYEELHCSIDSDDLEKRVNGFLSHHVNHYDVILAKLFFNRKMICDEIEQDEDYKELKHTISKAIGLVNEIYSYEMEIKLFSELEMNFVSQLVSWYKVLLNQSITVTHAFSVAQDYVDELLQRFDHLSNKLLITHQNTKIKNYLNFWKNMYAACILFCSQSNRYCKFFSHPIKYKFLDKFNIK